MFDRGLESVDEFLEGEKRGVCCRRSARGVMIQMLGLVLSRAWIYHSVAVALVPRELSLEFFNLVIFAFVLSSVPCRCRWWDKG